MTQYSTDFSEHTAGAQPSDWTERWNTASGASVVRADAGSSGGKHLEFTQSAGNLYALSWDDIDGDATRADTEILMRFRGDTVSDSLPPSDRWIGAMVRGSGGSGTETAYVFLVYRDYAVQMAKYDGGSLQGLTGFVNLGWTLDPDTWYLMRFRANGTSLRGRVWAEGDAEPGTWDADVTNSVITAAGWVGFYGHDTDDVRDIDYFGVGTNGDAAPDAPELPVAGGGGQNGFLFIAT